MTAHERYRLHAELDCLISGKEPTAVQLSRLLCRYELLDEGRTDLERVDDGAE